MKIQNAPLGTEQLNRIQHFIIELGNKTACCQSTGIDARTIERLLQRKWASTRHIQLLMNYCDEVEGYKCENANVIM